MRSPGFQRPTGLLALASLALGLLAGLVPGAPIRAEERAPLFCENVKSRDDAQKLTHRWEQDFNSANTQHRTMNLGAERGAYLTRAGQALRDACVAKAESEARYQALKATAAKNASATGESCDAFRAQEQNLVAGGEARQAYIHLITDFRDGRRDESGATAPGLRELYRKGVRAGAELVDAQTNDKKPALERERAWAWASPAEGYFSKIQRQFEAEVNAAEASRKEIANYLQDLQRKNPGCQLSEKGRKLAEGGRAGKDPAGREATGGSELGPGAGKTPPAGGNGSGASLTGGGESGDGHDPAKKGPKGGAGGEEKESFLGENAGLIVGGVALAGAAGAAAFVLTNKKAQQSILDTWDDLVGNKKKSPGQGGPPLPRPDTIAVKDTFAFSAGLPLHKSRQSTGEGRYQMSDADHDARYKKLVEMGIGYRFYNYFWSGIESGALSQAAPFACAEGYEAFPKNEAERTALGYHRFHCYSSATVALFDNVLRRDQAAGFQSGVVMWSAPAGYRYAECEGMNWAGGRIKDGCVPRDDAMDDFEDYANFLASRYNGGALGKISHFVVWNENGSEEWCDYTPVVAKGVVSGEGLEKRIEKNAEMLRRVHAALGRHQKKSLMYVSTDQLWTPGQAPGHMGTRVLLDGIWKRLGTDYSWSVAVHPYGNVYDSPPAKIYTFANLEMVFEYQKAKLAEKGQTEPMAFPQAYLFATEQGWGIDKNGQRNNQARNLCLAHDRVSRMPWLIGTNHNYFHSTEANELSGGTSSQGTFFGLIPYAIPNSLEGAEGTPTGAAYYATGPERWAKDANNFCCKTYKVGCP